MKGATLASDRNGAAMTFALQPLVLRLALAFVAALLACLPATANEPLRLPVDAQVLEIVAADGTERARYEIEIARSAAARSRGLMHRTDLPMDRGMLFVFDRSAPRSFWMKNTPLPLDIIFADETGRIVRVAANTEPFSTAQVLSGAPARYVLEVHAGQAAAHGIVQGDMLRHRAIEP